MVSAEYLAGFFDGEGHLGFCGRKRHTFQLKITNCNIAVLMDIQESWGGRLRERFPEKKQHAISYTLMWSAKQALPVLSAMLPHLIVKKAEAQFFLSKWTPHVDSSRGFRWMPEKQQVEYHKKKNELRAEFQTISHSRRGTYPLQVN